MTHTHIHAHTNRVLKGWENTKAAAAATNAVAVQKRLNYGKGGKRASERGKREREKHTHRRRKRGVHKKGDACARPKQQQW